MKLSPKRLLKYTVLFLLGMLLYQYWKTLTPADKSGEQLKQTPLQKEFRETKRPDFSHYSEFQRVNDNTTYVYAGYYDDRDDEAEVKVIAMIPRDIPYNFTCTVHYVNNDDVEVTGYARYHFARAISYMQWDSFRNGYVICPVSKMNCPPTSVSIVKQGTVFPKTNVTVWPPPKQKNKVVRCIKPLIENYNDISQIISNIELHRILGVDKHILYMDNQTQQIVDLARSYAKDGIVEFRNFTILQPDAPIGKLIKREVHWGQWSAYHDCLLSQMYSSKYVMVIDVDEIVIPRKHRTIWEMADDLFAEKDSDPKEVGALMFRNVYYPTFLNKTNVDFPRKDLAVKYNIDPLLYTSRMKFINPYTVPKSLVRPEAVDVMFIHYVEIFKKGWRNKVVDADVATMHHYRNHKTTYMLPPETEDNFVHRFSDQLITAVEERFKKLQTDLE